jgi:hypothetical protein
VDYSYLSSNPDLISPYTGLPVEPLPSPASFSETFAQAFLSSIWNSSGGFGRVKSVLFVFQEGDTTVNLYGPIDVAAPPPRPFITPSALAVNPLGNTAPSPFGNTAPDD